MIRHRSARVSLLIVAGALGGLARSVSSEQPPASPVGPEADLAALQSAFARLADRMRPSVVAIRAERRARAVPQAGAAPATQARTGRLMPSLGSGVVIREDGVILTNEHVVQDAEKVVVVLHDGASHVAGAVRADPRSDLAVVVIDVEGLQPAALGDLARVRQGHWAFAMGNPFGLGGDGNMAMSQGIVSAIGRKLHLDPTESRYYGNLIQTSAAVNPGNSGGPLVNIDGEVIGITTAISTRTGANEGVGFAVPIETRTRAIIDRLLRGEPIEYGYLGVSVRDAAAAAPGTPGGLAGQGAVIEAVEPDSPAERARLMVGDVLHELGGTTVVDADHLVRIVGAAPVGKSLSVVYSRQGRRAATQVTPAARTPIAGSRPAPLSWRGLMLAEPTPALRDRFELPPETTGLVIVAVAPRSAADRAGLKPGQVIVRIGEVDIATLQQVAELLPTLKDAVTLTRAGDLSVELPPP